MFDLSNTFECARRPARSSRKPAAVVLVSLLVILGLSGRALRAEECKTDLPLGSGDDLTITTKCGVGKNGPGPYKYGVIHIIEGGSLQFMDAKIDLWAKSILVEKDSSLIAGVQGFGTNQETIVPIGTKGGPLTIHLYGDYTGVNGVGIACKTKPTIMCGVDKSVWNRNEKPYSSPNNTTCTSDPLPGGVNDCFYKYDTMAFDDGEKDRYFGYKVLAVSYGGTLRLYGADGATYADTNDPALLNPQDSGRSWARLNTCAGTATDNTLKCTKGVLQKDATSLVLDGPANKLAEFKFNGVNWKAGDQVVVTTTDYFPGHSEVATIEKLSADGKTVTLAAPGLVFPHNASLYDLSGRVPSGRGLTDLASVDTRAAVGLLTRSIKIVSGGNTDTQEFLPPEKDPTKQSYNFGGHVVLRQGFKKVQIQGVQFYQLGQGGRIGHYPVHFHMARKVPADTFVKDSTIWDSMTRFIVLHGTQNVLLARNVGYQSIGHGYYLEDGTETNNRIYANLGVSARAASNLVTIKSGVKTTTPTVSNPRQVPGILAYNTNGAENVPYNTDYAHPTIFWAMNAWNDFQFNMAAGAETCGSCYWMLPASISGGSKMMAWTGYASEQREFPGHAATVPIKEFLGNTCMSASFAFSSIGNSYPCLGALGTERDTRFTPIPNPLLKAPKGNKNDEMFYPVVDGGGLRKATKCSGEDTNPQTDCSTAKVCADGDLTNCMVTVVDRFTSAFNATETNFAALWFRPQWSLLINSAITDALNAALSFVTGGGYTHSDVPRGDWMLARKSVFVGNTQDPAANPFASNGGPFNPTSKVTCDNTVEANYCLSAAGGINIQRSNFGVSQRFFNIYDGPSFEDSNTFLDITRTTLDDCDLNPVPPGPRTRCAASKWMQGKITGIPGARRCFGGLFCPPTNCYLPNAGIAWKQPNGFYYPPSFHSTNLSFNNVEIRHYVIEPLFKADPNTGKRVDDTIATADAYCNGTTNMFSSSFTDIDRQTELSDDDGTLTGLTGSPGIPTVSVNQDSFFAAPSEDVECRSDIAENEEGTAITSPYEYITTAILPDFAPSGGFPFEWSKACTNQTCFGVTMFRNFLNPGETARSVPPIRMGGQDIGQRSTITANNGVYYIDTSVPMSTQQAQGGWLSVFQEKQKYHVYVLFAKKETNVTYQIYVGNNFDINTVKLEKALIPDAHLTFTNVADVANWPTSPAPSVTNGVLTVNLNMNFPVFQTDYTAALPQRCQPASMCAWDTNSLTCKCSITDTSNYLYNDCVADNSAICKWGIKDVDFPDYDVNGKRMGGAYGFSFTLPAGFQANGQGTAARPTPGCFPNNAQWNVLMADSKNGGDCPIKQPPSPQFCQ